MKIRTTAIRMGSVVQLTALPKIPPMDQILLRSCIILMILICRFGVGIFWPYSYISPFQMASARVSNSIAEVNKPKTNEWVEKYIEPYDWYKINNMSEPKNENVIAGYQDVEFLGPIELVGSTIGTTSYFPCTFGFYSKNRSLESVESEQTYHSVRKPALKLIGEIISLEYQFNLNDLRPELNPFDPRRRTIILIPGFLSGDYVEWMHEIKNTWLALEDVNVILVHWSRGNSGLYESAVKNTRIVSRQITILLYYLAQWHDVDFKSEQFRQSIYLVGHSCGAHIASYVGQELGGQVARITGLDPAGPVFEELNKPRHLLSPHDAKLVDIIHTNAGKMSRYLNIGVGLLKKAAAMVRKKMRTDNPDGGHIIRPKTQSGPESNEKTPWYGIDKQIGHIDYYVNGGSVQPGCNDELHVCDHNRAVDVYLKTLEFELAARRTYGPESETIRGGLHRLMGFKAKDYDEFRSGASFMLNCPGLLLADLHKYKREDLDKFYKLCTIPLDFVTPVEKLKKELIQEYGLRDDYSSSSEDHQHALAPKYYFDTLPEKPIVSDTYLLRVHLDRTTPVEWQGGCQFFSYLNAAGPHKSLYSAIDFIPKFVVPHQIEKFYGVVLPVLNPNDWRIAFPSRQKIMDQLKGLSGRRKENCFARIRKLLPSILSINLSYMSQAKTESFLTRSIGSLSNIVSPSGSITAVRDLNSNVCETCSFNYTGFELRPFSRALNNSFSLWFSDDIPADSGQIPKVQANSEVVHKVVDQLEEPRRMNLNSHINRIGLAEVGLN